MPRDPRDFMLGGDPEFTFTTRFGEPRNASAVLSGGTAVPLGTDGHSFTAEIRPGPSYEPLGVVRNIRKLLYDRFGPGGRDCNLLMAAGCRFTGHPTGGHIHFGFGRICNDWATCMCKWLDVYLLPVVACIESRAEAVGRLSGGGYGRAGDHRIQTHGLEYRPLASWLTSPYVAQGILALAKTIAWHAMYETGRSSEAHYTTLGDAIASNLRVVRNPAGLSLAVEERNISFLRNYVAGLWPKIAEMSLFGRYTAEISFIKHLFDNRKSWFPKCGMRAAWGIPGGVPYVHDTNPLKERLLKLVRLSQSATNV